MAPRCSRNLSRLPCWWHASTGGSELWRGFWQLGLMSKPAIVEKGRCLDGWTPLCINMIQAPLLSFLSLIPARLDQTLPPDIRLDHSSRFQVQLRSTMYSSEIFARIVHP